MERNEKDGSTKYGRLGGFKTPEEAEESYKKCLEEYEKQRRNYIVATIDKEILLKDYLIYWYENIHSKFQRIESTTKMVTCYTIYNLILPNLPYDIKVRLTTSDYINETLDKLDKLGKTTANRSRETFNWALKEALKDGVITVNPVDSTKFFRRGKTNIKLLSQKEIKTLLSASCKDNWYLEILLALFCGLRKGEIRGLKFSDFNEEKKTVKIQRQLGKKPNTDNSELKVGEYTKQEIKVKTFSSNRELEIPDIVFEAILEERKKYERNRSRRINDKTTPFKDYDFICCSTYGNPRSKSFHFKYWKSLLKDNNLPNIRFHDLRATYCTLLIKNNFNLKAISKQMGHATEIISVDVYGDNEEIISDCLDELEPFIDMVKPEEKIEEYGDELLIDIDENYINSLTEF